MRLGGANWCFEQKATKLTKGEPRANRGEAGQVEYWALWRGRHHTELFADEWRPGMATLRYPGLSRFSRSTSRSRRPVSFSRELRTLLMFQASILAASSFPSPARQITSLCSRHMLVEHLFAAKFQIGGSTLWAPFHPQPHVWRALSGWFTFPRLLYFAVQPHLYPAFSMHTYSDPIRRLAGNR